MLNKILKENDLPQSTGKCKISKVWQLVNHMAGQQGKNKP